jgi:hypothetical protein
MESMVGMLERFERIAKRNQNRQLMVARQKVGEIFVGLSPKTLANLHSEGKGPPVYKKGRIAFYKISELAEYLTTDNSK